MWWALTHKTPSPRNHPFYNFLGASARHFPNNLEKCLLNKCMLLNKCIPGQLRQLKAPRQGKWPPNILNRRRNIPSWDKHLEEISLQLHVQNLRSHVGIGLQKCLWPHRLRMRPPNTLSGLWWLWGDNGGSVCKDQYKAPKTNKLSWQMKKQLITCWTASTHCQSPPMSHEPATHQASHFRHHSSASCSWRSSD